MDRRAAAKPSQKPQPKQPPVRRAKPVQEDELTTLLRETGNAVFANLGEVDADMAGLTDLDALVSSLQARGEEELEHAAFSPKPATAPARTTQTSAKSTTTSSSTSSALSPMEDPGLSANFDNLLQAPRATLTSNAHSGVIVQIQNMVASLNLGCTVRLKDVAMYARNAEYNPNRFSAVIMRLRNPNVTALIFESGKIVVSGAKAEYECRLAARKFARIVQKIGHPEARILDFNIYNVVGTADVRFPVDLDAIARDHEQYCTYEPEIFPGTSSRPDWINNRICYIFLSTLILISPLPLYHPHYVFLPFIFLPRRSRLPLAVAAGLHARVRVWARGAHWRQESRRAVPGVRDHLRGSQGLPQDAESCHRV